VSLSPASSQVGGTAGSADSEPVLPPVPPLVKQSPYKPKRPSRIRGLIASSQSACKSALVQPLALPIPPLLVPAIAAPVSFLQSAEAVRAAASRSDFANRGSGNCQSQRPNSPVTSLYPGCNLPIHDCRDNESETLQLSNPVKPQNKSFLFRHCSGCFS